MFYWSHRILHHPSIYPYIHKQHHQYAVTISLAAEYAHPIEFVFGNLIPTIFGAFLLDDKAHIVTYMTYLVVALMGTTDQHCGYEFPWSPFCLLPTASYSDYHNFHHYQNVGNYAGVFTFWDTLCGTNRAYNKFISKAKQIIYGKSEKKNE